MMGWGIGWEGWKDVVAEVRRDEGRGGERRLEGREAR